jgi:predicted transcriptional regulator
MSREKDVGYTSALKLLQIMTTKGLVTRIEDQRAHVYTAALPAEKTKQQMAADVLQRVFRGSASQLMQHALSGKRSSKQEIDEIRKLLDEYERKLP